jgi:hypothetical protein
MLADLPESLRAAARDPALAAPLVYALLAGPAGDGPDTAGATVARHDSTAAADAMRGLRPAAGAVPAEAKLPLLQLALGPLRGLNGPALDRFAGTLDELVHADGRVSILEFALQKSVLNTLRRAAAPAAAPRFQSFQPLAPDFAVLLSALAHASPVDSPRAFAHGLAQVPLLAGRIALQPPAACGLEALDAALDRLAAATLPIRQRALVAAAHVVGADGTVSTEEAELYRAVTAALQCPAPAARG